MNEVTLYFQAHDCRRRIQGWELRCLYRRYRRCRIQYRRCRIQDSGVSCLAGAPRVRSSRPATRPIPVPARQRMCAGHVQHKGNRISVMFRIRSRMLAAVPPSCNASNILLTPLDTQPSPNQRPPQRSSPRKQKQTPQSSSQAR